MAIVTGLSELKNMFVSTPVLIGDLPIDVLLDETPVFNWDITERPVEGGSDITDHRLERPVGLILECIFTNSELGISNVVSGAANVITGGAIGTALSLDTWQDKKDALYSLMRESQRLDITTPLDTYTNMMISSVRPNQNASNADAFFFRVELKEVDVISTEIIEIDESAIPKELKKKKKKKNNDSKDKTQKQQNKGTKQGTEADKRTPLAKFVGVGS